MWILSDIFKLFSYIRDLGQCFMILSLTEKEVKKYSQKN